MQKAAKRRRAVNILVRVSAGLTICAMLIAGAWLAFRIWPRPLSLAIRTLPSPFLAGDQWVVPFPTQVLLGRVGRFDDELTAYLWFDYLRSRTEVRSGDVLLIATEEKKSPAYEIRIIVPNDALTAIPFLAALESRGYIRGFDLMFSASSPVEYSRKQTEIFVAAYQKPVERKLESLSKGQLLSNTARFLAFKSRTDPRVRGNGSQLNGLSAEQANELAADIIAVSNFYDLPLDIFLGIGAMENNYLDVRGDLEHSVWKRRAAPGDIILKRRRHRVLVSDYSIGVWQITRETLRYAHGLYRKDKRDYSNLPDRLVPPMKLELDLTDSHVLTTYAGLLLRDLLDHFGGDMEKAVGAYNGGKRSPNSQYAAGVQMVASYARNILERVSTASEAKTVSVLSGKKDADPGE